MDEVSHIAEKRSNLLKRLQKLKGSQPTRVDVAVVSVAFNFPGGVRTPQQLWQLLSNGQDAITSIPPDRWDVDAWYDPNAQQRGKMHTRWGGFLNDIYAFEPEFFGISAREASFIDPQQRIVLEAVWELFERGGQCTRRLAGSQTGVFLAVCHNEYQQLQLREPARLEAWSSTGVARSIVANRLSYSFDLRGPSVTLDTACSSSLVAIHLACQSVASGESTAAVAGGVNLMLAPETTVAFSQFGMLARDGRCKVFDAAADGFVRSEGCGLLLLKRLEDAQRDNDPIVAVIRGSATNQDGRSHGMTAPNMNAQRSVIRSALANAGCEPAEVTYVEAHGTGTLLGDPIEVEALRNEYDLSSRAQDCALGAIKANIGHLESAAGVAGVIKVIACLQHQQLVPQPHFHHLNPNIDLRDSKLFVSDRLTPWRSEGPRRAVVSSFGFGGSNAHVVLSEAPAPEAPGSVAAGPYLLGISAKTVEALKERLEAWAASLRETSHELADLAYTCGARSEHHDVRCAVVVETREQMLASLESLARDGIEARDSHALDDKMAFVCGGQGAQSLEMAADLRQRSLVFRRAHDEAVAAVCAAHPELAPELFTSPKGENLGRETWWAQPAILCLQVAQARLWESCGVRPHAVLGHSVGDIAASHLAGRISLEEAARIAVVRGRTMQQAHGNGRMLAVFGSATEVSEKISELPGVNLIISVINSPEQVVVSGTQQDCQTLLERGAALGLRVRDLDVAYAFHNPLMGGLPATFAAELGSVEPLNDLTTQRSLWLGASGLHGAEPSAEYWQRQMELPVDFQAAVSMALDDGVRLFVELGPGPVLANSIRACMTAHEARGLVVSTSKGAAAYSQLLAGLGQVYEWGVELDWDAVAPLGRFVELPTYPWQRHTYTLPSPGAWPSAATAHVGAPGAPRTVQEWPFTRTEVATEPSLQIWHGTVSPESESWLSEHRVDGTAMFPAGAYVAWFFDAAQALIRSTRLRLSDVRFLRPLVWSTGDGTGKSVQLVARRNADFWQLQIFSRREETSERWDEHARCQARGAVAGQSPVGVEAEGCSGEVLSGAQLRSRALAAGVELGTAFSGLREARATTGAGLEQWLGELEVPASLRHQSVPVQHTTMVDACLQLLLAATPPAGARRFLPVGIDELVFEGPLGATGTAILRPAQGPDEAAGISIFDGVRPVATLIGIRVATLSGTALSGTALSDAAHTTDTSAPSLGLASNEVWVARQPSDAAGADPEDWLLLGTSPLLLGLSDRLHGVGANVHQGPDSNTPLTWVESVERLCRDVTTPPIIVLEVPAAGRTLEDERVALLWILKLCQTIMNTAPYGTAPAPRWVVLSALDAPGQAGEVRLTAFARALWGALASLLLEAPRLSASLVHVSPKANLERLIAVCRGSGAEEQWALQGASSLVPRLHQQGARQERLEARNASNGAVFITGGLGGIGRVLIERIVQLGARHIALTARRELTDEEHQWIANLERQSAHVQVLRCDVANRAELAEAVRVASEQAGHIAQVFHLSGVVRDAPLQSATQGEWEEVFAAKAEAARFLDELTRDQPLRRFVCLSSLAAVTGSPGQAAYAAANGYLRGLCAARREQGLPAECYCLGLVEGVGMAAALKDGGRALRQAGIVPLTVNAVLDAMLAAVGIDSSEITLARFRASPLHRPLLEDLALEEAGGTRQNEGPTAWTKQLLAASPRRRLELLRETLRERVAVVMRVPVQRVRGDQPLSAIGLDSVMSVDLRASVETDFGEALPPSLLFDFPTLNSLARFLADRIEAREGEATSARVNSDAQSPGINASHTHTAASLLDETTQAMDATPPPCSDPLDQELAAIEEFLAAEDA